MVVFSLTLDSTVVLTAVAIFAAVVIVCALNIDALKLLTGLTFATVLVGEAAGVLCATTIGTTLANGAVKVTFAATAASTNTSSIVANFSVATIGISGALARPTFATSKFSSLCDDALSTWALRVFTTGSVG